METTETTETTEATEATEATETTKTTEYRYQLLNIKEMVQTYLRRSFMYRDTVRVPIENGLIDCLWWNDNPDEPNMRIDFKKIRVTYNNEPMFLYNPFLYFIIVCGYGNGLKVHNLLTDKEETLNNDGRFFNDFAKGYNEGINYYKTVILNEIRLESEDFFRVLRYLYVNNNNFNGLINENEKQNWIGAIFRFPLLLTPKEITKYGFYSALCYRFIRYVEINDKYSAFEPETQTESNQTESNQKAFSEPANTLPYFQLKGEIAKNKDQFIINFFKILYQNGFIENDFEAFKLLFEPNCVPDTKPVVWRKSKIYLQTFFKWITNKPAPAKPYLCNCRFVFWDKAASRYKNYETMGNKGTDKII